MRTDGESGYNFCLIGAATSVGRVRKANEDSMVIFESANMKIFVVCDGMGGHVGGQVASQTAVATIKEFLTQNLITDPREAIRSSMLAANDAILRQARLQPELSGMGSTCAMLVVTGEGKVYYGHVGDSRIYIVANRRITQLTRDHSFVQMLVDAGQITKEEAENHPRKNEITNALGLTVMQPPTISGTVIEPDAGNCFLLCSDGLTGMVSDAQIERVVSNRKLRIQERAGQLVQMANDKGGHDNITVQLVEFALGTHDLNSEVKKQNPGKRKIYFLALFFILILGSGLFWLWLKPGGPQTEEENVPRTDTATGGKMNGRTNPGGYLTTPVTFVGSGIPVIAEILNFSENDSMSPAGKLPYIEVEKIQGRYVTIRILKWSGLDTLFIPVRTKLSGNCTLKVPILKKSAEKQRTVQKNKIEIRFDSITYRKRVDVKIPDKYKNLRLPKDSTLPTNHPDVKCDVKDEKFFMIEFKTDGFHNPVIINMETAKEYYLFVIPVRKVQEVREQI